MTNDAHTPDESGQAPEEFETEFHYPVGKFEEELVRDPHGGWAPADFDSEEFDYEFDESELDESEFSEADYGEEGSTEGDEAPLSEEEWEALSHLSLIHI